MLRIRSKLWNSRVYWGHWNKHNNQEDAHLKHGLPEQLVAAVRVGVVECRLDSFLVLIRLLGLGKEQPQLGEIIDDQCVRSQVSGVTFQVLRVRCHV